ncbi:dihydroneopterin aldolase [Azospirillum doebereinerae]|uniref:dihydroneopterin aldolase n=1 Tax=Azospirillum doebereinerae TaxID=92933 RepID=UPI00163BCD74|nr:dihydroneopterin aldolase [Azospirillum doebereinerae]
MSDHSAERHAIVQPGGATLTYTILVRGFTATVALAGRPGRPAVRIDLTLTVTHPGAGFPDNIAAVMSYEDIVEELRRLCADETIPGPDYLAERAADLCLTHAKVQRVRVDVELPSTAAEGAGAGASITRAQQNGL